MFAACHRILKRFARGPAALLGVWMCATAVQAAEPNAEGVEFFEKRIRPLLVQNCLECHADKHEGGLRLDSATALATGGDSGPAVAPGNPDASLLLAAVRYQDEPKMPPAGKLPDDAIAAIETWIKLGAPWPADSAVPGNLAEQAAEVALGLPAGRVPGAAARRQQPTGRRPRWIGSCWRGSKPRDLHLRRRPIAAR